MRRSRLLIVVGGVAVAGLLAGAGLHAAERLRAARALWVGQRVPVLIYHDLVPGIRVPAADRRDPAVMPVSDFAAEMDQLSAAGYHPVRLSAFVNRRRLPPRPVLLTLDDGYASTFRYAYPVLARHGFPATVFVLTGRVGQPGFLTWREIRAMRSLVDVGCHTTDLEYRIGGRPVLDVLPRAKVVADLRRCRRAIAAHTGTIPTSFAYPFGKVDPSVAADVRAAGFTVAFGGQRRPPAGVPPRFSIARFPVPPGMAPVEFRLFALDAPAGPSAWAGLMRETFAHGWSHVTQPAWWRTRLVGRAHPKRT